MTPSHSRGTNGRAYRYYVSPPSSTASLRRVAASAIETLVRRRLASLSPPGSEPLELVVRITLGDDEVSVELPARLEKQLRRALEPGEHLAPRPDDPQLIRLIVPARFTVRNGGTKIRAPSLERHRRDPVLIRALRSAHSMATVSRNGVPLIDAVPGPRYHRRLLRLAFLSPTIQRAILDGRQPAGLKLEDLVRNEVPIDWSEQERLIERLAG